MLIARAIVVLFSAAVIFGDDAVKNYTGSYIIVAPRTIRPGLPYSVSVNILQARAPVVVNLRIQDEQNNTIAQSWARDLKAGQPQTAVFETLPATLTEGNNYRLYVKGQDAVSSRILFEQFDTLNMNEKSRSTFIQTDKAIYKPGSTVHFRIVVVTPDLKPYKGKATIKVSDPNQNVIKQFVDQPFNGGVLGKNDTLSLQLSDEPPLGDWKIAVDVDGQKTEKTFSVDKYVLPKFEVVVKPPPYTTINDDVTVLVTAKYTYGKGVAGTATITADYPYNYWGEDPNKPQPISKTLELNNAGEATVRFLNSELKQRKLVSEYGYNQIRFTATVTESLTGTQRNGTGDVTAYKYGQNVKIEKQTETFKPDLDYNVTISVVTQDDKPVAGANARDLYVIIYYYFPYVPPPPPVDAGANVTTVVPVRFFPQQQQETQEKKTMKLGSDGTVVLTLKPPHNASSLRVEARYGSETSEIMSTEYADASKSPTFSYLQLLAKTSSVKAGEEMKFRIRATEGIDSVTVQVMTRGYMVISKQVKLTSQNGELSFAATSEMAPKSRIIAYAVRADNKEILADAMDFRVEGFFKNNVSIEVNPKRAEPNDSVTFTIKAAPSSYIGLLAVDQSVLLLKSGNDITDELVESDISQYDTTGYGGWRWGAIDRRRKRSIWCRFCWWNIGGKDAATVFDNSGVLVLTDAYLYREPPPPMPMPMFGPPPPAPPPAAAPGAPPPPPPPPPSAGQAGQPGQSSAPKVRTKFPETWVWADAVSQSDGTATYRINVPDTITSWITSAFAINEVAGLGVAPDTTKLEVFRSFFIRLDLPYSVKRGEKLALPVYAFNYMETEQRVEITLEHNDKSGFDFVEKPGATKDKKQNKQLNLRYLNVPPNGGSAAAYFPIVPTIVGEVKLLIKAIGNTGSDAIEMPLLVEAEGFPMFKNNPVVMELTQSTQNTQKRSVQLDIPANAIPGSQRAEVSVTGDIMGPVLNNIDKLVQMPYGCGEQNMLNFVPNIVVVKYLKATNRLTPALEAKALKYMEAGYQREMTYQRDDFSYSAFGKSDPTGSTWLTAFVCRSFRQAKAFIFVDEDKLKSSVKYLKSQQKENGVFEEHGNVHHKAMQGGSGQGGAPLTAYVLLALMENGEKNPDALNYLERSLDRVNNDSYSLAIITYALHVANSSKRNDAFQALERLAVTQNSLKHWSYKVDDDPEKKEPSWWNQPRPVDVEMTAYALLTYVLRGDTSGALPLVRWLATQRNEYGGFSSTQDTVVALQALGAYASKVYSAESNMDFMVRNGDFKQTFKITPQNAIVLQSVLLKNLNNSIELEGSGRGIAYAQVSYHFNVPKRNDPQPFVCDKSVKQDTPNEIQLQLCCNYALKGKSNMVVVEASAPSGYVIDEEKTNKLTSIKDLQRVEYTKGGTQTNIYINSMSSVPLCFNVSSDLSFQVAEQKPALVTVYDYYDPGRRIEFDYLGSKTKSLQEVCGAKCWQDEPHASPSVNNDAVAGNSTNAGASG